MNNKKLLVAFVAAFATLTTFAGHPPRPHGGGHHGRPPAHAVHHGGGHHGGGHHHKHSFWGKGGRNFFRAVARGGHRCYPGCYHGCYRGGFYDCYGTYHIYDTRPVVTTVAATPVVETVFEGDYGDYVETVPATTTTTVTTTDPGFELIGANVGVLGINVGAGVKVGGGTTVSRTTRVTRTAPVTRQVWVGGYYNTLRDTAGRTIREYVPGHYETVTY